LADVMAITKWSIASGGCDEDAARKGMEWMRQRYRERGQTPISKTSGFRRNEYRVVLHRLSGQSPISAHARNGQTLTLRSGVAS
jgi:hypothetical protein